MKNAILLCVALTACGPLYSTQVSSCRLTLLGENSDTFDRAACDAVTLAGKVYGVERAQWAAQTFYVVAHAVLPSGVQGETVYESQRILLDTDDWYPSALAHELVHACESPNANYEHEGPAWEKAFPLIEEFHHAGSSVR